MQNESLSLTRVLDADFISVVRRLNKVSCSEGFGICACDHGMGYLVYPISLNHRWLTSEGCVLAERHVSNNNQVLFNLAVRARG